MTVADKEERRAEDAEVHRSLQADLAKIRTGRATPACWTTSGRLLRLDGADQPGGQRAWAMRAPSACSRGKRRWQAVEKAIRDADLGLNPATMGDVIRVPMPR
jgi:ribosome recycling factor